MNEDVKMEEAIELVELPVIETSEEDVFNCLNEETQEELSNGKGEEDE